jgi:hypothetical protein
MAAFIALAAVLGAPTTFLDTVKSLQAPFCSNGIPNDSGKICCDASCGVCGGVGCKDRPGGEAACCGREIKISGKVCASDTDTACFMDVGFCSGGKTNPSKSVCCPASCAKCGGPGCANLGEDCCTHMIKQKPSPLCVDSTSTGCVDPDGYCSVGIESKSGNFCCPDQCGACGGSGCSKRPGGADLCCTRKLKTSGLMCADDASTGCQIPKNDDGKSESKEETAADQDQGEEEDEDCVYVNHQYDRPGKLTCECVMPGDSCLTDPGPKGPHCVPEPLCSPAASSPSRVE